MDRDMEMVNDNVNDANTSKRRRHDRFSPQKQQNDTVHALSQILQWYQETSYYL